MLLLTSRALPWGVGREGVDALICCHRFRVLMTTGGAVLHDHKGVDPSYGSGEVVPGVGGDGVTLTELLAGGHLDDDADRERQGYRMWRIFHKDKCGSSLESFRRRDIELSVSCSTNGAFT